jgi:hypothetical protein
MWTWLIFSKPVGDLSFLFANHPAGQCLQVAAWLTTASRE